MRTRLVQLISTLFILTFVLANPALAESNDPNPSLNTPPAAEPEKKKKRSLADRARSAAKRVGPTAVACFAADVITDNDVCEDILDQIADWIRAIISYAVIGWWKENCFLIPSNDPSIGPGQTFVNPACWRQL